MRPLAAATTFLLAFAAPLAAQTGPCLAAGDNAIYDDGISMGGPNLLLAIQESTGNVPLTVFGLDVFTGERTGPGSLGLWSHDQGGNRPLADLGTAAFDTASPNDWQGTNLNAPVTLPANTTFWIVWGPVNGSQASVERRNSATGQPYRGSFDGGQSWNGPFVSYDWKYRLWCAPRAFPGVVIFGRNCPGSGRTAPRAGASALPRIGSTVDLTLGGTVSNAPAFACFGFSDSMWGSIPLPFDLRPLGAPGCSIWIELLATSATTTDGQGRAALTLSIPNQTALLGGGFLGQWLVADSGANSLGFVTSEGVRFIIGH